VRLEPERGEGKGMNGPARRDKTECTYRRHAVCAGGRGTQSEVVDAEGEPLVRERGELLVQDSVAHDERSRGHSDERCGREGHSGRDEAGADRSPEDAKSRDSHRCEGSPGSRCPCRTAVVWELDLARPDRFVSVARHGHTLPAGATAHNARLVLSSG